MSRMKVAVLRGGPSHEYPFSLKSGGHVLHALSSEQYEPLDILIDRDGHWHRGGFPVRALQVLESADVIFNALHGAYGEDGALEQDLVRFGIPHTGPGVAGSILAVNKHLSKSLFEDNEIKTPRFTVIDSSNGLEEMALSVFQQFSFPFVVKPVNGGGSIGLSLVHAFDEIAPAIQNSRQFHPKTLVEEYISGMEVSCAVMEDFRGKRHYALLPVQMRQEEGICSSALREAGEHVGVCPAPLTHAETREVERLAGLAHSALHLRHYSQSEFIVSPRRGIYILETDALPHLDEKSALHRSLEGVGSHFGDFLDHVLSLALRRS